MWPEIAVCMTVNLFSRNWWDSIHIEYFKARQWWIWQFRAYVWPTYLMLTDALCVMQIWKQLPYVYYWFKGICVMSIVDLKATASCVMWIVCELAYEDCMPMRMSRHADDSSKAHTVCAFFVRNVNWWKIPLYVHRPCPCLCYICRLCGCCIFVSRQQMWDVRKRPRSHICRSPTTQVRLPQGVEWLCTPESHQNSANTADS